MECNRYVSPRVAELCVSGKRFKGLLRTGSSTQLLVVRVSGKRFDVHRVECCRIVCEREEV